MYRGLWRILPGGRWAKIGQLCLLLLVVLLVLDHWVFPWVAFQLWHNESIMGR
jgi:hypothetical protein